MYDWRNDIKYVAGALSTQREWLDIDEDERETIIENIAGLIVDRNGADFYLRPEDAIEEERKNFEPGGAGTIWAIELDSPLFQILEEWYGDYDEMMSNINYAILLHEDGPLLFATGSGYDILSADLLGGSADGLASREFDEFVDERMS